MKNKTLFFYVTLIAWALAFFSLGMYCAKADMVTDSVTSPAYHFMPQNLYHNTIYNNHVSDSYTINKTCSKRVDRIVVYKSKKRMILVDDTDCVVKEYKVRVGLNEGPKHCEGDMKTPEGVYHITSKRDSQYHRFLAIDYPQLKDRRLAAELKCNPGHSIGIHAYKEGLPKEGSQGCITVWTTNEIAEIDSLVKVGTTVMIRE